MQMQRAVRAPQDFFNAVKTFRCQGCDNTKPRPQTHRVSPRRHYTFHHEVGDDVFEIVDSVGMRFSILNAFWMETIKRSSMDCEEVPGPLVLRRHQGHALLRQRIDGHDSQRMLERRQREDSTWRCCPGTMGTLTSSTQSCHHGSRR